MTVTPFSNGTEYEAWCRVNCDRCAKYDNGQGQTECPIALDLICGYVGDGTVSDETARRMGGRAMRCTELVPLTTGVES